MIFRGRRRRILRLQKGRAKNDHWLVERTVEILCCKFLLHVRIAARMDNPQVNARDREAGPEFDKGYPALPSDREPNEAVLACKGSLGVQIALRSSHARKLFPHTS